MHGNERLTSLRYELKQNYERRQEVEKRLEELEGEITSLMENEIKNV